MKIDIKVPGVGESISEGSLASWSVSDGAVVKEGDTVFELETDKTTLDVSSPAGGSLHITVPEGTDVKIGDVVGYIDTEAAASGPKTAPAEDPAPPPEIHKPAGLHLRPKQPQQPPIWIFQR